MDDQVPRAHTIYKNSNLEDSCGAESITEVEGQNLKHRSLVTVVPDEHSNQDRNQSQVRMKPPSSNGTDGNKKISKESYNSKQESLNFSLRRDHLNLHSGSGGSQISQVMSSKFNNSNENNHQHPLNHSAKRTSKASLVPKFDFKTMQNENFGNRQDGVTSPCNMGINDDLNNSLREPNETHMMSQ